MEDILWKQGLDPDEDAQICPNCGKVYVVIRTTEDVKNNGFGYIPVPLLRYVYGDLACDFVSKTVAVFILGTALFFLKGGMNTWQIQN